MATIKIGDYVRRVRKGRVTRTHRVESLVAEDVITTCGKRMRDELGGLEAWSGTAPSACAVCFRFR